MMNESHLFEALFNFCRGALKILELEHGVEIEDGSRPLGHGATGWRTEPPPSETGFLTGEPLDSAREGFSCLGRVFGFGAGSLGGAGPFGSGLAVVGALLYICQQDCKSQQADARIKQRCCVRNRPARHTSDHCLETGRRM